VNEPNLWLALDVSSMDFTEKVDKDHVGVVCELSYPYSPAHLDEWTSSTLLYFLVATSNGNAQALTMIPSLSLMGLAIYAKWILGMLCGTTRNLIYFTFRGPSLWI
jgi:hypothetical protein